MINLLKKMFSTSQEQEIKHMRSQKPNIKTKNAGDKQYSKKVDKLSKGQLFPKVATIDDPSKRKINEAYRLSDDLENMVRVNPPQPKGTPKKVLEFVPIAGIQRRKKDALKFAISENIYLELEKEPDNSYDKNAIKVNGICTINGNEQTIFLGYVPGKYTKQLSNYNTLNATIKTIYYPTDEKGIGFRMDIWSEKNNKKVEGKSYNKSIKVPDDSVDRNLDGKKLEKEGYIDNAIEFYEANVLEKFEGNFPYDRLAIIYRKRKQYQEEVRVLKQAISLFEKLESNTHRSDVSPKLMKFKERLNRAEELANKENNLR
ncbi:tetratricopeptide (TPR) repeat protein [Geomicrobium halophilum]|uniref:Tetratricopeptide (TPR) repeat protein n=1 Tax=Geomicrobium halophilum TaxID=549000 RepID=A0A841PKT8_9BACL|nr:HIRAN domain-containing protein [Geomicrobium halophilum]MBB6449477.1 tetratricopeptide (TPR) repeat protein [Geomicrobium halophilum]